MNDRVSTNKRRSALLIAGFVLFVLAGGWILRLVLGFGFVGLLAICLAAAGGAWMAWWKGDAIALATAHARPAEPATYARFHNLVEGLCIAGGLPKPGLYVVEDDALNAFAAGRGPKHAVLAVTTGLVDNLSRVEMEAVLAHELSHIKSYDVLTSTLAVTTVGGIALLSDWTLRLLWWGGPRHADDRRPRRTPAAAVSLIGFLLLVPSALTARLMQLAVSQRREALADMTCLALTRYPPGLISALEKLRDESTVVHSASPAIAHLWIETPIAQRHSDGRLSWLNRLFNTHPPIEERIQALREL